uniref:Uncharacterized protein n=1 Tax=Poecilia mexicana TaxID=48701 RepID=A0A3B3YP73_9TELE
MWDTTLQYFRSRSLLTGSDAVQLKWSHAVNSRNALAQALSGPSHMIEADVIMRAHDPMEPIMAHPPDTDSDITLKEWLEKVKMNSKGIKLDFKSLEAVSPSLALLEDLLAEPDRPLWINADVLSGPNGWTAPVDFQAFLSLVSGLPAQTVLSLGWTTGWTVGTNNPGEVSRTLCVSLSTVHRRVQEMGYRYRIPQVKPLLNQKQRQKCLTWATEKQHWTVAQWSKVLFSDESKFCMSFGNQGARVWRKTGEKEMPKCQKSSVKYPQSVMVWDAMSAAGVGPLCFIKGRVNAASYQEILEHFMLPSAEKLYGDEDSFFSTTWHLVTVPEPMVNGLLTNWPANSPDLNPIENMWDIVKRKLRDPTL